MNESEIRTRLRDAIGDADYPPALTDRVATRIHQPTSAPRSARWLGLIAGALAVVIVMSLVYVRAHYVNPVRHSTDSTQIPAEVMDRTFLNPVAGLLSRPDIQVRLGDRTITLVAAYADPLQLALIFRVLPVTQGLVIRVLDDVGAVIPVGMLRTGPDGFQYTTHSGPHAGPDGNAHLQTILADSNADVIAATPVRFTPPQTTFSIDLKVWPAARLAADQGPIAVGTWKVTIETFERTPLWIYMFAVIAGAPTPTGTSTDLLIFDSIALFDPHGIKLNVYIPVARWGTAIRHPGQLELDLRWSAPADAGTYTLAITGGGGTYRASVPIPARPTN